MSAPDKPKHRNKKTGSDLPDPARAVQRTLTAFAVSLDMQMAFRGYSSQSLIDAIELSGDRQKRRSLINWRNGKTLPRHKSSFRTLEKIEQLFQLPDGRLAELISAASPASRAVLKQVPPSLHWVAQWHLPKNFDEQPYERQQEIVAWVEANVLAGITDYGKYQRQASQTKYSVVFPTLPASLGGRSAKGKTIAIGRTVGSLGSYGTIPAPVGLAGEMEDLVAFKTAALPPRDYRRYCRWVPGTSQYMVRRYGTLFGALAAAPFSAASGLGVPLSKLTFGLLVFPAVWDWFLQWSERKRGFFTMSESSTLYEAKSTTRDPTGWLRQHPEFASRLHPIDGLVSSRDIASVRNNWTAACDKTFRYACDRVPEMLRARRGHRDPFAAILPVLSAESPLAEYKKIADEILRLMPNGKRRPVDTVVAVRSYLMIRLALHLGLRQRNLRELLLCPRGRKHRTTHRLEELRRGELRWNETLSQWEVFMPAVAFKNGKSSFFQGRPFHAILPDLEDLYAWIEAYNNNHRAILLGEARDPGTLFVRKVRYPNLTPEFEVFSFYDAWKAMVRRYGIYNPYTGRGAIAGLLPHGPHSVRDILATHILKQTGSYDLAGFAIQDTAEAVMRHYARFLPHEKTAKAAKFLNQFWTQPENGKALLAQTDRTIAQNIYSALQPSS